MSCKRIIIVLPTTSWNVRVRRVSITGAKPWGSLGYEATTTTLAYPYLTLTLFVRTRCHWSEGHAYRLCLDAEYK
jgi:hypothetical protein